jgi:hypothetical protein
MLGSAFCTRTILSQRKNDPVLAFCSASMYGQTCGFWRFASGFCILQGTSWAIECILEIICFIALIFIGYKGCQGK